MVASQVLINQPKEYEDWIAWGNSATQSNIVVQRGLNVSIESDRGTFYGEWKENGNQRYPCGRGALYCSNKWILGYTWEGKWILGSWQVIIEVERKILRVYQIK